MTTQPQQPKTRARRPEAPERATRLVVLSLLAVTMTNCATSVVLDRSQRTRVASTKEVAAPGRPPLTATLRFDKDDLEITANGAEWCSTESVEVVETVVKSEKKGMWYTLVAGAVAAGGGAVVVAKPDLLTRSTDPAAVVGTQVAAGAVAAGGLALLIAGIFGYAQAGTSDEVVESKPTTTLSEPRVCKTLGPIATDLVLSDSVSSATMTVKTDANGRATVSASSLEATFKGPWAKTRSTPELRLGAGGSVIGTVTADSVAKRWTAEQEAKKAKDNEQQAAGVTKRLFEEAQAALQGKQGVEALAKLDECLKLAPSNEQCSSLRGTVAASEARRSAEVARSQFAAKKFWEAQVENQRCLSIEPTNAACLKLKPSLEAALARVLPHHVKDSALYDEGGNFVAYFSLVNAAGEYVPAAGKVLISIAADSNGFTATDVAIGRFEVVPTDFKVTTIGMGAFARKALVWRRFLSAQEVYGKFNFGRAELHSLESGDFTLYVQYRFMDATGRELAVARDLFHVP